MPVENDISHIKSFVGIIVFTFTVGLACYIVWRPVLKERAAELRKAKKRANPIFIAIFFIAVIFGLRSIVVRGTEIREPIRAVETSIPTNDLGISKERSETMSHHYSTVIMNIEYAILLMAFCYFIAMLLEFLSSIFISRRKRNKVKTTLVIASSLAIFFSLFVSIAGIKQLWFSSLIATLGLLCLRISPYITRSNPAKADAYE